LSPNAHLATAAGFALLFFFEKQLFLLAVFMSKIDLIASVPLMFHKIVGVRL
jgi:hypothetical protein